MQKLQIGKILIFQIRAYIFSGFVLSDDGDHCGGAAQLLMSCSRGAGNSTERYYELTCADTLIAFRRSVYEHNEIFGTGANKECIVFHAGILL